MDIEKAFKGLNLYQLKGRTPVPAESFSEFAEWHRNADLRVAFTEHETFRVSTVFLTVNPNRYFDPPRLFETMAFTNDDQDDLPSSLSCYRYVTWEEAEEGHAREVERLTTLLESTAKNIARVSDRPKS